MPQSPSQCTSRLAQRARDFAVVLILLCGLSTAAQTPLFIRGTVSDATGAVIPNVTVQLDSSSGTTVAEAHTDGRGNFTLPNLQPGDFTLIVPAKSGFAAKQTPIHLATTIAGLKILLAVAAVNLSTQVGAEDAALSTDSAANRDTFSVSAASLRKLPVYDQNYVAALLPFLDPGDFSSGGVTLVVDGVEMKSAGVSASAIQEVRINNDPYSAEFTRPGRGRIEIITKPGSPQYHGEFNFLFRDATLNARNYFAPVRPPEQRRIYEGHLSGPVGHGGHTTFILSGSRQEEDIAASVHAIGPSGPIEQNVATPTRSGQISMRVTHDFSPAHRLSLGYNFEYSTSVNGNVGGLVLPEAGTDSDSREDDLIFNDRIIVSPNLINQVQITLEKDEDVSRSVSSSQTVHVSGPYTCGTGQSILVSGAFTCGSAQSDSNRTENTIHINDFVSWSHKNHYLRFGANIPQISRRAVNDRTNRLGTFNFASLDNFVSATPYSYTVLQGVGRGVYWINELGAFIQDQIKVSSKLQLSLGVRYDFQTYIDDHNNFSPRFSVAYAPGKGKTILRAGGGFFYDRTGGDFPAIVKLHNGIVLQTLQELNPGIPLNLTGLPSNIVRFDPHTRSPYTMRYSVGVERQLGKSATVSAGYRGQVQAKSFRSRDANAPVLPPNPILTANYPRPNPAFGQVRQIESGGRELQNAVDISFRGDIGTLFSGQAQYTLSSSSTNTGGLNFFPQDQYLPNDEWGRSGFDQRHRFNLLGNINPDHWLTLGVALALAAGAPYTTTTGADYYHTGLGNARPAGGHRSDLQAAGNAVLDLSWGRDFPLTKAQGDTAKKLSVQFSAFNILNHTNYSGYIGNITSPLYQQPTTASSARQLQFEFGYQF